MTTIQSTPSARITEAVHAWPGVESGIGSRGEFSFRVGRREIGHLHGDRVAHFGLPRRLWAQLLADGTIERHPIDKPGWGAVPIRQDADVDAVIALMRLNYDRATAR